MKNTFGEECWWLEQGIVPIKPHWPERKKKSSKNWDDNGNRGHFSSTSGFKNMVLPALLGIAYLVYVLFGF